MATDRIAVAQRGVVLAEAVRGRVAPRRRAKTAARTTRRPAQAAGVLSGPFLSPGTLTRAERLRLIEGIETVIAGVYTHLPLKRARYGTDPVQRLRILRSQVDQLTDDAFHLALADLVTRLRDAHTRYAGPVALASKVAALPFLVEMIGTTSAPTYVVTKVGHGLATTFRPGVVLEYWNGVPIDRAVQRYSESEVGGRPDSQRAWATQSLTLRSLQYTPPPDEHWVIIGYRATNSTGTPTGPAREIKIPWQVIDPSEIAPLLAGGPTGRVPKRLRRTRAIDPAAAAIRQAKMLLFAPGALTGGQAAAPKRAEATTRRPPTADVIATSLTDTLKAMSISAPGGAYGYLRIYGFDTLPGPFIAELVRLIPLLPDRGLILDVRGNPGGYIWAAELALQLFTPKPIQPTRFSLLATPFTRDMAGLPSLRDDLGPWKASLDAAVRNGELYSQPIPITDVEACNSIGQQYGGPVVLVSDSTTYSAGDLFSAGFVDNGIGPFICVGEATGAGGANVWDYAELRSALAGSPIQLPALPDGIGLSLSYRRATRSGPSEGLPIEDIGIAGASYALTRDDLLAGNRDLIAHCITLLGQLPLTTMSAALDSLSRTVTVTTRGLSRIDALFDGHPGTSASVTGTATTTIAFPTGTKAVDLTGWSGGQVHQRRRFVVI
ncbi:MAG: S41 family peptidase [Actinomycetota bacterium]|nr:S41 family peptidase [Actinomycetota bacterium]